MHFKTQMVMRILSENNYIFTYESEQHGRNENVCSQTKTHRWTRIQQFLIKVVIHDNFCGAVKTGSNGLVWKNMLFIWYL